MCLSSGFCSCSFYLTLCDQLARTSARETGHNLSLTVFNLTLSFSCSLQAYISRYFLAVVMPTPSTRTWGVRVDVPRVPQGIIYISCTVKITIEIT